VCTILNSLGEVARDAGRPVRARRLFSAALRRNAVLRHKRHMAYDLEGLAAAAALENAGRQALVYLGAAQVLRDETGGPLPPVEQAILDRILAPAVAALSARERQEALSQGRNQPLPATIAHALAQVPRLPAAWSRSDRGRLAPLLDKSPQLLPSLQAALGVDVAQVILDGLAADEQLGRDLRVGEPLPDQVGHFGLPAGQRQHWLLPGRVTSLQPGQGRLQVADLPVLGPQPGYDGGRRLGQARADQALGQQRPPQHRVWSAAAAAPPRPGGCPARGR